MGFCLDLFTIIIGIGAMQLKKEEVLMYKIKIIYINKIKGNIYLLRNIRLSFFYFLPDRISTLGLN